MLWSRHAKIVMCVTCQYQWIVQRPIKNYEIKKYCIDETKSIASFRN